MSKKVMLVGFLSMVLVAAAVLPSTACGQSCACPDCPPEMNCAPQDVPNATFTPPVQINPNALQIGESEDVELPVVHVFEGRLVAPTAGSPIFLQLQSLLI